jgi:hypothetical protein
VALVTGSERSVVLVVRARTDSPLRRIRCSAQGEIMKSLESAWVVRSLPPSVVR